MGWQIVGDGWVTFTFKSSDGLYNTHLPFFKWENPNFGTQQDPVCFLGTKAFLRSPSFEYWVPKDRLEQLLINELRGYGDKWGTVKKNSSGLGQGPGYPQGIYITIPFSCFEGTKTPIRWKKLMVAATITRPQKLVRTGRLMRATPTYLTTNQSEKCPWTECQALFFGPYDKSPH